MKELLRSPVGDDLIEDYPVPPESSGYAIGDTGPAGGIIFFVDTTDIYPGFNYLEAAPADISTFMWASTGMETILLGTTLTAIGSGAANTAAILGSDPAAPAAAACDNYALNGYTDWFLPSRYELNQMYINRSVIGGFGTIYWSSSENDNASAWFQLFSSDTQNIDAKNNANWVRAVRAF